MLKVPAGTVLLVPARPVVAAELTLTCTLPSAVGFTCIVNVSSYPPTGLTGVMLSISQLTRVKSPNVI